MFLITVIGFALIATTSADPITVPVDDTDTGNVVVQIIVGRTFNSTGCIPKCISEGRCNIFNFHERTLQECVDCTLECSPATACYKAKGYTLPQISDAISSTLYALYLDGCRFAEAAKDCEGAVGTEFFTAYEPKFSDDGVCPDETTLPSPSFNNTGGKQQVCDYIKCSALKAGLDDKCKRGAMGFHAWSQEMSNWIRCDSQ